jgi:hypothetical protein
MPAFSGKRHRNIGSADDLGVRKPVFDLLRGGFGSIGAMHRILADRQRMDLAK